MRRFPLCKLFPIHDSYKPELAIRPSLSDQTPLRWRLSNLDRLTTANKKSVSKSFLLTLSGVTADYFKLLRSRHQCFGLLQGSCDGNSFGFALGVHRMIAHRVSRRQFE